ncbi:MAG: hypothetical protein ACREV1_09590, partial [Gammaproteobacteria bacterium]
MMKRSFLGLAVSMLLAVSMAPVQPAEAAFTHVGDFFICGVTYDALATIKRGKHGHLVLSVKSGPDCT